jgi:copper(I)-binding protein
MTRSTTALRDIRLRPASSAPRPTGSGGRRGRSLAAVLVAVGVVLAGCGSDAPVGEVAGGAIGPDERVSEDVSVLAVHLEYPLDGRYEEGEDARLFLAISNTGLEADVLVDVRGPDFADVRTTNAGDGGALAIEVPADDNVYVGAEGRPALTLVDLDRSLTSSQSIPVTFTFQRAGEVTVDAMVAAERQHPTPTYDFPDPAEDPTEG